MTYDNEAIVRAAYRAAEGGVMDVPAFVGSFTHDGVCNDLVAGGASREKRSATS
jgi:hypothetical protein